MPRLGAESRENGNASHPLCRATYVMVADRGHRDRIRNHRGPLSIWGPVCPGRDRLRRIDRTGSRPEHVFLVHSAGGRRALAVPQSPDARRASARAAQHRMAGGRLVDQRLWRLGCLGLCHLEVHRHEPLDRRFLVAHRRGGIGGVSAEAGACALRIWRGARVDRAGISENPAPHTAAAGDARHRRGLLPLQPHLFQPAPVAIARALAAVSRHVCPR